MSRKKGIFGECAFVVEAPGEKKRAFGLAISNGGGAVCTFSKVDSITNKGFKVRHYLFLCFYTSHMYVGLLDCTSLCVENTKSC